MGDIPANPLVADIARSLQADGRIDIQLDAGSLQAVVDVGWAARKAGQLLGRPVRVSTARAEEPGGGVVVTAVVVHD